MRMPKMAKSVNIKYHYVILCHLFHIRILFHFFLDPKLTMILLCMSPFLDVSIICSSINFIVVKL